MKVWLLILGLVTAHASAQSMFGADFTARGSSGNSGGSKDSSRWTLTDYLSQKQKVRLMDQWLSLNGSAVKLESIISGGSLRYDMTSTDGSGVKVTSTENITTGKLSIFYTIFGVEGEYEKSNKDWNSWSAMGSLRLLGSSQQNTNLTASYGFREKKLTGAAPETFQNQFAQGSLNIYITSFMGIDGTYRTYFDHKSNQGRNFKGVRASAGLFFEIKFLRIFGQFHQENSEITPADGSAPTKEEKHGIDVGARIFL